MRRTLPTKIRSVSFGITLLLIVSCGNRNSSTSSGGSTEVLPDKVHEAALLLVPYYDVSPLSFVMFDIDDGTRMDVLRDGTVRIRWQQDGKPWFATVPIKELACTFIHELWHYHNYDAPVETREINARAAGRECSQRLA